MLETEEAKNIGEVLRNARLKRGKTLSDVSKDLCIRKVYLEAIENLDGQVLPPVPYGVGFVRTYSEYLELNTAQVILAYKQAIKMPEKEEYYSAAAENEPDAAGPDMRHLLIGLGGMIAVVLLWSFFAMKNEPEKLNADNLTNVPEPVILEEDEPDLSDMGIDDAKEETAAVEATENEPESSAETVKKEDETAASEAVAAEEQNPEEKTENIVGEDKNIADLAGETEATEKKAEPVTPTTIRMVLQGPSWVELRHKDKVLLSGIYAKGFTYDIPDEKDMVVSVGRYYNVDFYVNGILTKIASSMKQMNINLNEYIVKNAVKTQAR